MVALPGRSTGPCRSTARVVAGGGVAALLVLGQGAEHAAADIGHDHAPRVAIAAAADEMVWELVDVPLAEDDHIVDVAVGAGGWWLLLGDEPAAVVGGPPRLLYSADRARWEAVDLGATGIPAEVHGPVRLWADDTDVVVLFGAVSPGASAPTPWLLRGDGARWRVIDPVVDSAFTVADGEPYGYQGAGPMARVGDTLVSIGPETWPLGAMADRAPLAPVTVALGAPDDGADSVVTRLPTALGHQRVAAVLAFDGSFHGIGWTRLSPADGSLAPAQGVGAVFEHWHSPDGLTWTERRPEVDGVLAHVEISSAAAGPAGIVAVGSEADDALGTGSVGLVLVSADGERWERVGLEQPFSADRVLATADGYYAYQSMSTDMWFSADGRAWRKLETWFLGDGPSIGLPTGLIVANGPRLWVSSSLL